LIHKREQSGILPPTAIVKTLDPKIEAAILRCLKPGPEDRPPNALAVAAALPGGDPLAAALAAGETPSPQMVAAAGQSEALHPAIGLALVATIVAGLIAYAAMGDRTLLYSHVPMQRTLGFLDDRAREIAASFGFPAPYDTARGLSVHNNFVNYVGSQDRSDNRWNGLKNGAAPVMLFWHRESPTSIVPMGPSWVPMLGDPPLTTPGMVRLTLDDVGRLVVLEAVPPITEDTKTPPTPAPWNTLFSAGGFDMTRFRQVDPMWVPRAFGTERAAWEGTLAAFPDVTIRVEAAAFKGRPVFFRTVGPWTPPDQPPAPPSPRFWQIVPNVAGDVFLLGTLLLARNNLRAGRGDRRGAARLFVFTTCVWTAAWIIGARHYGSFPTEDDRFFVFMAQTLMNAGILWLLYVALEPYVRRYSPQILISWTRALGGQIVDARIGRDVLIGVTVGVAMGLLGLSYFIIPQLVGEPPGTPRTTNIQFLLGAPATITSLLRMIPNALQTATAVAVAFAFGRAIGGRTAGAALFAAAFFSIFVFGEMNWDRPVLSTLLVLGFVVPMTATLVYCGLLPSAIAFLVNQALSNAPMTLHPSRPYAAGAFWSVTLVVGLTVFGFYASRKGQPLFGRLLRD
jgi:serine/threonine-protein kinase